MCQMNVARRCADDSGRGRVGYRHPCRHGPGAVASLKNAPYASYVEIAEGAHTVMLEKDRMQLFRAVQSFLDEPAL
jgi:hypothetical protein